MLGAGVIGWTTSPRFGPFAAHLFQTIFIARPNKNQVQGTIVTDPNVDIPNEILFDFKTDV